MSDRSKIEWTRGDDGKAGATWNPVTGCSKVSGSRGCELCYAETFTQRWRGTRGHYFEQGFDVQLREEKLGLPLQWKRPRRVFVNSLSDLLHKEVPDEYIAQVWAVMALAGHHTFQVLTKRPGRMRSLLSRDSWLVDVMDAAEKLGHDPELIHDRDWPLRNVWVGTSVEEQKWAGVRVPVLLDTPAAVRFVSAEPLLGPLDLTPWLGYGSGRPGVDWVIAGGETGHGARPMHPGWPRALRDQCLTAGTPFFFKQWGSWRVVERGRVDPADRYVQRPCYRVGADGTVRDLQADGAAGDATMMRVRPTVAGRVLDGRTWDEFPAGDAGVPTAAGGVP